MIRCKIITIFILCLLSFSLTAQKDASPNLPVDKLRGTWVAETRKGTLYERWQKIDNKTMMGKSFKIAGEDTITREIIMLTKEGDNIFYTPTVIGQNNNQPVRFKLTAFTDSAYTFENPEHDFPKRIIYEFTGADTIHAYTDNGANEKKRQHFYYKRVR